MDYRTRPYSERHEKFGLIEDSIGSIEFVETHCTEASKGDAFERFKCANAEGVVFKNYNASYLETACTSDAGAHALMGCLSDPRGAVELRFYRPGAGDHVEIQPPEAPRLANVRLGVPGWARHLHHVAMLDRSGDLLLAPDDAALWRKLREKMSCPTLGHWGTDVIGEVHHSEMLVECETFGIADGLKAYVLAPGAQEVFDNIISKIVRARELPQRIAV